LQLTAQINKDNNLEKTLTNLNGSAERLKSLLAQLEGTLNTVLPNINGMFSNLNEVSLKLKAQPWRIIWPNTIKYPQKPGPISPRPRKTAGQD